MALIKCSNCGKPISDKAVKCPHCGEFVHSENLSIKVFGFHKAWILVLIGVFALWGLYCLDVLNLHIINDDYATNNAKEYYECTMTACLIAISIATLLVTINLWRKPIKVCFYLTLAVIVALVFAGGYDRFNPSDSDGRGQKKLAESYLEKEDYQNALKWFEKASDCGDADAMNTLGSMYGNGTGVEKNLAKAMQLFQQAAEIADNTNYTYISIKAHRNMGIVYQKQENIEQAKAQYEKALQVAESEHCDTEAEEIRELIKEISKSSARENEVNQNLRTKDLTAFLLHGKVKEVVSRSGQCFTRCCFNEAGKLVKYESGDNHNTNKYEISHNGNELGLVMEGTYGSWGEAYRVNGDRLTEYEAGGDGVDDKYKYSNYDSNNWPPKAICYSYDMEQDCWKEESITLFKYSDIDKYGNWQKKYDSNGDIIESREIKYYSKE